MAAWLWLALGIALILAEAVVPGLVVVFLGLGALSVALGIALGLFSSVPASLAVWIGTSLLYVLGLRRLVSRRLPGEMSRELVDEQALALGQAVEVVETVSETGGRVRYQGTTWPARTLQGRIEPGQMAMIAYRDDLHLVVEPAAPGSFPERGDER